MKRVVDHKGRLSAFVKIIKILHKNCTNETEKEVAIKFIVDYLHHLPIIFTGLVSEDANKLPYNKMTNDHFFSRTQTAKKIFDFLDKKEFSDNRLALFIQSRCRVHKITKKENMDLRKIMNNKKNTNIHWREAYKNLGINLVQYVNKSKKYVYNIEDLEYNSISEISRIYKISTSTVYYRCNSKSEKFKNWQSKLL